MVSVIIGSDCKTDTSKAESTTEQDGTKQTAKYNAQLVMCLDMANSTSLVYRLDKDFGQGTAEDLHAKAIQITKYSNNDIQGLITKYTALVKKKMK